MYWTMVQFAIPLSKEITVWMKGQYVNTVICNQKQNAASAIENVPNQSTNDRSPSG